MIFYFGLCVFTVMFIVQLCHLCFLLKLTTVSSYVRLRSPTVRWRRVAIHPSVRDALNSPRRQMDANTPPPEASCISCNQLEPCLKKKKKKGVDEFWRRGGKKKLKQGERESEKVRTTKWVREKEWNDPFTSSNTEAKYNRGSLWLVASPAWSCVQRPTVARMADKNRLL